MDGCGVPVTVPWSQSGQSFVFCEASPCRERAEKSGGHLPCAWVEGVREEVRVEGVEQGVGRWWRWGGSEGKGGQGGDEGGENLYTCTSSIICKYSNEYIYTHTPHVSCWWGFTLVFALTDGTVGWQGVGTMVDRDGKQTIIQNIAASTCVVCVWCVCVCVCVCVWGGSASWNRAQCLHYTSYCCM